MVLSSTCLQISTPVTCKIRIVDKDDIDIVSRKPSLHGRRFIDNNPRLNLGQMKGQQVVPELDSDFRRYYKCWNGSVPTLANGGIG